MASVSLGILTNGAWIKKAPSPYTPKQILQWLARIGFEHTLTSEDIANDVFPKNLENLEKLSRLHLKTFPFENIAMHYEKDHLVDVTPQGLFKRLVLGGKGSYCFGLNGLLLGMLRGLGFRVYGGAARVNMAREASDPVNFQALTHMVLFAQPGPEDSNETYLVDVGFGGSGLSRPMLLSDQKENMTLGTTPSERHRLVRKVLPSSSLRGPIGPSGEDHPHLEYQLHVSHTGGDEPWRVLYSFTDREFFLCDYEAASFDVCTRPTNGIDFFWDGIVAVKLFALNEAESEEVEAQVKPDAPPVPNQNITGKPEYLGRLIMMGREVKKVIGTRTEIVATLETDADRIRILRDRYGINVADEDAIHIRGRKAALDD